MFKKTEDSSNNVESEKLGEPPGILKILGWISIILVILLSTLLCINVKFENIIKGRAVIQAERSLQIQSPLKTSQISKVWIGNDKQVIIGDTLLTFMVNNEPFFVQATVAGTVRMQRDLVIGDSIPPLSNVLAIEVPGDKFLVRIFYPSINISSIKAGQEVKISLDQVSDNKPEQLEAYVVNEPYASPEPGYFIVDAYLKQNVRDLTKTSKQIVLRSYGTAFSKVGTKRLIQQYFNHSIF